jgi:three-Cys-motif partner protein
LNVQPSFDFLHFIDVDKSRVEELKTLTVGRQNVQVHRGDCNRILIQDIFPNIRYEDYERALCILDPYGLHLDWQVVQKAGESRVFEIFLNFPVMDMNMNVFWANPDRVTAQNQKRMTRFWGDESWKDAAYEPRQTLFGEIQEKNSIKKVVDAFRTRLKSVAGFQYVPDPMPMRNTKSAIVYFLFFAAQQPAADKIVKEIFAKYRERGEVSNG